MINDIKSEVLTQALPYIQKYNGKVVVVKYGGHAMVNEELKQAVMSDIILLSLVGVKVVLVHGGGPDITQIMRKMRLDATFVNGLRYTDAETAEVAQMVLAGKVNKALVSIIGAQGGKAVGVCGIDGGLLMAHKKVTDVDLGYVGEVTGVNCELLEGLLEKGYTPVIASVGCDENGQVYNINADEAAASIAIAMNAENILLMTDTRGILADVNDENSLITNVKLNEVALLEKKGIISGGMIPKVNCCVQAVREGVKKAVILDGRVPHTLLLEMLTDSGIGTLISSFAK